MHATPKTESRVALTYSDFKICHRLLHSMAAFESATPTFLLANFKIKKSFLEISKFPQKMF